MPPLSALRALESAARLASFTRAADELNVTQGAVSHAVKSVEAAVGRRLFLRRHQEIAPTRAALDLAAAIRGALDRLDDAFERLVDHGGRLTVKVQPTVAMRWVMPRLGDFKRAHPTIDLRISIGWDGVDFSTERFDAGIVWNPLAEDGVTATLLFEPEMIAVAAPAYLRDRQQSLPPNARDRIIHNEPTGRTWRDWLTAAGLSDDGFDAAISTDTDDAAIRLAMAGQGITLASSRFVEDELAVGTLVMVGPGHRYRHGAYYLVALTERSEDPAFIAFRDWLLALAAAAPRAAGEVGTVTPANGRSALPDQP